MHLELYKLKGDHQKMSAQIIDCQKKLRELELKMGFEFGDDPRELFRVSATRR